MRETSEQEKAYSGTRSKERGRRWLPLSILGAGCLGLVFTLALNFRASALTAGTDNQPAAATGSAEAQSGGADYSRFTHTNPTHAQLPCLLCHQREGNSSRPALPGKGGHLPCAGCHTQQFADRGSPMCGICHTNAEAGALKPFPGLKSFNMRFNHALHVSGGAGCATCHRPERRGVALSIPSGFNAHNTCYQCHGSRSQAQSGRDISSCGTCHQQGGYRRTSASAAAYSVSFSHAKHGPSQRLNCGDCHTVRAGATQGAQVTKPLPLNHHAPPRAQSCMTCHNGKRAFGGDDFSSCKRCHQGAHFYF